MSAVDMDRLPEYVRAHQLASLRSTTTEGDYEGGAIHTDNPDTADVITSISGESTPDKRPVRESPVSLKELLEDLELLPEELHRPVLDIDFAATLIPSTTEGHFHLYLDKLMPWKDFEKLLVVMGEVGILEQGYVDASIARHYSSVRLPWVKKPDPEPLPEISSVRDLLGIDPDWTGGLSSVDFVRQQRDRS